jgi:hypothetical protein
MVLVLLHGQVVMEDLEVVVELMEVSLPLHLDLKVYLGKVIMVVTGVLV